jgi:CelD/BcsL family acetyltransferase involved in cellulose biosynthesis
MAYLEALRGEAPSGKQQSVTMPATRSRLLVTGASSIELRSLRACGDFVAEWHDLAQRSLQPNVFYEPEIALAAAQHLVGADSTQAVLVWDRPAAEGRRCLLGLFPVKIPGPILPFRQLKGMASPYFASGVPLVDRECAPDVLEAILRWLGSADSSGSSYLLPRIDLDGQFACALMAAARTAGRALTVIGRHYRPLLKSHDGIDEDQSRAMRLARLKVLRRQIGSAGKCEIIEASEGAALRDAAEIFMAMEASGRRGRAGTAIMMQTRTSTFLRTATRGLGQGRHCRLTTLMQGETPLAAALLYESGPRAWLVDLVHDETFARYAPGEYLALALTERQARHGRTLATEQCSTLAQPALDRLWPDQIAVADILVSPARNRKPADLAGKAGAALANLALARRTGLYMRRLIRKRTSQT